MQVTRPAGSGAYRELSGDMCFRAGRKRGDLLMARAVSCDGTHPVKAIAQAIQRVACDSPYPLYAGGRSDLGHQPAQPLACTENRAISTGASRLSKKNCTIAAGTISMPPLRCSTGSVKSIEVAPHNSSAVVR